IFTSKEKAAENQSALKDRLKKTFNNEPLSVDFLYNPTHGKIIDLLDSVNQKFFSQNEFEIEDADFAQMLNDASSKVKTQKLLLVGHSQGNFYANTFYNNVVDRPGGVPNKSIGVYGVASPASYVADGGRYLTSSTDSVINKVRLGGSQDVLEPNVDIVLSNGDGNGHSFSGVYLKYQSGKIVSDIKFSLGKLKNNDEKNLDERCIDPLELTLSQKIQDVLLASTDFVFDDALPYIGDKYLAFVNKTGNTLASLTSKVNSLFSELSANVSDGLPDTSVLGTITPDVFDSSEKENSLPTQEQDPSTDPELEEKKEEVTEETKQEEIVLKEEEKVEENKIEEVVEEKKENKNGGGGSSDNTDTNTDTETETEINIETDIIPPVITILGDNPLSITKGDSYIELGADSLDEKDGNISVIISGNVDTSVVGSYDMTYTSTDNSGNISTAIRVVNVLAPPLTTFTIDTNTVLKPGKYSYDNLVITNNAVLTLEGDPDSTNSFKGVEINAYNITIDAGASISADGQGYQDGPGSPELNEDGASYGGKGAGGTSSVYGSSLEPEDLGSGKLSSGRGGGAIKLIVTDTLKNNGTISANGINSRASGGSIYVKTNQLEGIGNFNANGSGTSWPYTKAGGGGRIALYYNTSSFSGLAQALAGIYCFYGCNPAADTGTVGLFNLSDNSLNIISTWTFEDSLSPFNFDKIILNKNSKVEIEENVIINSDEFFVDEGSSVVSLGNNVLNIPIITLDNISTFTLAGGEKIDSDSLLVKGGSTFTFSDNGILSIDSLLVSGNSSTVTVVPEKILLLEIPNVEVQEGAYISVDQKGYVNGPGTQNENQKGGLYGGDDENISSSYVYGSALKPVDFGSGGKAPHPQGGGAIRLVITDTLINNGIISANGNVSSSGGSIYVTTKNLLGNGEFSANGGGLYAGGYFAAPGGGGRVAVYYESSSFTGKAEAKGGCGSYDGWSMTCASKGTVGLFDTLNNDLYLDSSWQFKNSDSPFNFNNIFISNGTKVISDENISLTANDISIDGASTFVFSGSETINANQMNILGNSTLTILNEKILKLEVSNLFVETGSYIQVDGKGYVSGPGSPEEGEQAGASYGGKGGGASSKPVYGSKEEPIDFGSGSKGNRGGGAIRLDISGTLENNGIISASNTKEHVSGGSIYVTASNILGNGKFVANGGGSSWPYGSIGGGGGRIAIYYDDYSFSGENIVLPGNYCFSGCASAGESGTLHLVDKNFIPLSSSKKIIKFNFSELIPEVVGTIEESNHTISLSVPFSTDITNLVPNIDISDKASIDPLNGVSQNFSNPVSYIVIAEDGSTESYTVTVLVLPDPDPEPILDTTPPEISSFLLNDISGDVTINPTESNPLSINLNASENVNWMSIKIENEDDSTVYKIFQSGVNCVDDTNTCLKSWNGGLSSGGLLQDDTTFKIKVHIKDEAGNEFYDYLSPVITIDTLI
ncbi:hypothetical protein COX94_00470, partial [Candidatus Nomurabacteria bacterium CG_4_10_14_0_2_um_filter_33_9]